MLISDQEMEKMIQRIDTDGKHTVVLPANTIRMYFTYIIYSNSKVLVLGYISSLILESVITCDLKVLEIGLMPKHVYYTCICNETSTTTSPSSPRPK